MIHLEDVHLQLQSRAGPVDILRGVDLDVDGADDIFKQPYRGDDANTLLGTEDGPDIRIEDQAFLTALSRDLLAGFPSQNLEARIVRIDIYAPPYFETL